ncbi:hypothetical protein MMC20_000682 [Loxospora ochrophaea]|nr:hypothetical protein [Loxospora ochrophaea]
MQLAQSTDAARLSHFADDDLTLRVNTPRPGKSPVAERSSTPDANGVGEQSGSNVASENRRGKDKFVTSANAHPDAVMRGTEEIREIQEETSRLGANARPDDANKAATPISVQTITFAPQKTSVRRISK